MTNLKPTHVETPGLKYTFYSEKDADLTTSEGRIEYFCARFEVEPPKLEYDQDEPDQILATDDLLAWAQREGVSLDWAFCGNVTGALASFREKYRITDERKDFFDALGKMEGVERDLFRAGLTIVAKGGADAHDVMREVAAKIQEHRAG